MDETTWKDEIKKDPFENKSKLKTTPKVLHKQGNNGRGNDETTKQPTTPQQKETIARVAG